MGLFSSSKDDKDNNETSITNSSYDNNDELSKSLQEAHESLNGLISSTGNLAKTLGDEITRNSSEFIGNFGPIANRWLGNGDSDLDGDSFFFNKNLEDLFERDFFGNGFFNRGFDGSSFYRPKGLWAYPVPSVREYDACVAKDGLSVWDKRGVWRCLFPNAALPPATEFGDRDSIITKEDYLNNVNGVKDSFFESFNDLLGWKSQMRKIKREATWKKRKELESASSNLELVPAGSNSNSNSNEKKVAVNEGENKVVGTSKSYSSSTAPDGTIEQYSKTLKWYQDGSSKVEETRKLIPPDGSEPKTETNVKSLGPHENDDKSGWFWNN